MNDLPKWKEQDLEIDIEIDIMLSRGCTEEYR